MLKSKKHVFWEALLITIAIFILGLLIGISIEKSRLNTIEDYYSQSEVSLLDILALQGFLDSEEVSCDVLISENLNFADKIYAEARLLEEYESSNQLTESLKISHKKYDLLRTFVWQNLIQLENKCPGEVNTIVYLYEYESEDLEQKAKQTVWSNVLYDLKLDLAENVILLPIAADMNLSSINILVKELDIEKLPAVVVNNQNVLYEITSVEEIEEYLN